MMFWHFLTNMWHSDALCCNIVYIRGPPNLASKREFYLPLIYYHMFMCFPDLFQCNDAMRLDPKDRVRITTKHWDIEHIEHIERTRRLDVAGISAGLRAELQTPSACVSYHSYTTAIPQLYHSYTTATIDSPGVVRFASGSEAPV